MTGGASSAQYHRTQLAFGSITKIIRSGKRLFGVVGVYKFNSN